MQQRYGVSSYFSSVCFLRAFSSICESVLLSVSDSVGFEIYSGGVEEVCFSGPSRILSSWVWGCCVVDIRVCGVLLEFMDMKLFN